MSSEPQQRITPGANVAIGAEIFEVAKILDFKHLEVVDSNGKSHKKLIQDVRSLDPQFTQPQDLAAIPQKDRDSANAMFMAVKALTDLPAEQRTLAEVKKVAAMFHKHPATIYRWIEKYSKSGSLTSLNRKERSDKGRGRLSERMEAIIDSCIRQHYLTEQRKSIASVASEVKTICTLEKLRTPDFKTICDRIHRLDPELVALKRMGRKFASERFEPIRGPFPNADFPLAVIQIDHTPMDVIVVDDTWRKPINRAYLTLALDVKSKMVVGFYISLEKPGALATGLCISHAILDKDEWLASRGLDKEDDPSWPCWGKMRTIHMDNAKEFRGTMMGFACKEHGIIIEHRPKGKARYGGHVERGFRTFMAKVHEELPGTTFSNVQQKFEYDPDGRAVMTLGALELWFTRYVLGVYHQLGHAGNDGLPPQLVWQRAYLEGDADSPPVGIPHKIQNRRKLELDFMPYFERTVQEYGIQQWGVYWYSDSIRKFIHMRDPENRKAARKFVCRYDPRDLSRLNFYDPDSKTYIEVPFRDLTRPAISMWEVRQAKRELKADAKDSSNEELIFRQITKMRALVAKESEETKSARRDQQRRLEQQKVQKKNASSGGSIKPKIPPASSTPKPDTSETPAPRPKPRTGIVES